MSDLQHIGDETPRQIEYYESFRFEQTRVRVFTIDARKLAVGADVCAALDIKNSRDALSRLDPDDRMTISRSDTVGCNDGIWNGFAPQVQSVTLITENGATDLILESRKPEARRFRRFLTHTVWPSIRDTGSYSAVPELTDDELVHRALTVTAARVEALAERVAELAPRAEAFDIFLDATGKFSVGAVAKMLGTSQNRLFRDLRNAGVLIAKGSMRNTPYQQYMHHFEVKAHEYERSNGEIGCSYTTYVQPSGIDFIRRKLGLPAFDPIPAVPV